MSRGVSIALGLVFLLPLILPVLGQRTPITAQQSPVVFEIAERPVTGPAKRELMGTISCSSSLCHGGSTLGQPGSEATTWRAFDPHARAFDALSTSQARAMVEKLGVANSAHEEPLCLKCHVHPEHDPKQAWPNFRKDEGVSCESCHGAAGEWLPLHYQKNLKQTRQLELNFANLGLADTKSLSGRAAVCVGCHVGAPEAEVDHGLIAAGHPALRFEFATYLANLPPHWNLQRDKKANSTDGTQPFDFEARAWVVGQLITTASALDLLAHRADPKSGKTWPEFAELDCFACHHELQGKNWRQDERRLGQRSPGALAWNRWYYAMLPDVLEISQATKSIPAAEAFASMRDRPERNLLVEESRRNLAKQATVLATSLRDAAHSNLPVPGASWFDRLGPKRPEDRCWDEATQRYLALLAMRGMQKEPPLRAELEQIIMALQKNVTFRAFDSPRDFVPAGLEFIPEK